MHAVSTMLLLASLGTSVLAMNSDFHGIIFTYSDSDCLLPGRTIVPMGDDKGQFSDDMVAVTSRLQGCTLFVREEIDGEVREEPVLVIDAGDRKCHERPESGLHWNVVCEDDEENNE